jgi:hypothetical protein
MKSVFYLVPFLWLALNSVHAETFFVHSAKAPLFESAAFNSPRLQTLVKGDEVTILELQKRWVNVQFGDQQGWVPALLVNAEPPIDKVNLVGSDSITIEGEARRRASAVATAGATRGLAEGDGAQGLASDYSELQLMEGIDVTDAQIDAFSAELIGAEK